MRINARLGRVREFYSKDDEIMKRRDKSANPRFTITPECINFERRKSGMSNHLGNLKVRARLGNNGSGWELSLPQLGSLKISLSALTRKIASTIPILFKPSDSPSLCNCYSANKSRRLS
jgi:hypothetical protein